jgi:hypothetical protein
MKRVLSLILILILCLSCVACSNTNETTPEDELQFDAPRIAADMKEYLEKKYDFQFECHGYSSDETSFIFATDKLFGTPVTVYLNSALIAQGYPIDDFPGHFSDDVYLKMNTSNIATYYRKLFAEWGVHRILVSFESPSLPAAVDLSWSYSKLIKTYPQYMSGTIYLLTDASNIADTAYTYVESVLADEPNDMKLVVIQVPASQQGDMEVSQIVAEFNSLNVLYQSK